MIRVLVPTDFSDHSYNALSYAHMLFQEVAVEFTLFNAYEASALQLVGNKSPLRLGTIYKSLKVKSLEALKTLKKDIDARNEIKNHTYVFQTYEGHLRDGVDAMSKNDFDFIIIGSKGATGLKEIFIGSVTQSIVSLHQEIPLLIVPEKANFRVPDNIGFATDFTRDYAKEELAPLLTLTDLWKSTVRMVEVYDVPGLSPAQKTHLQHLEMLLMDVNYRFHVIPEFSSLENCINAFNNELEIDLMVLIDYPKNFFERLMRENVIKKMTFHTTLPFLILPGRN
ncbi:universal stress protein [Dokdonia sinensis]|uniref:Universal stress protein n=1 Tax=Dokdonia sinensis TaxID=2479847 RepID=A0A3M0H355_9FLAO|nr:universal stress protein [Dokdonia sinensis]RMB64106.1 universal stress protein [Dokdonia sinensis]